MGRSKVSRGMRKDQSRSSCAAPPSGWGEALALLGKFLTPPGFGAVQGDATEGGIHPPKIVGLKHPC